MELVLFLVEVLCAWVEDVLSLTRKHQVQYKPAVSDDHKRLAYKTEKTAPQTRMVGEACKFWKIPSMTASAYDRKLF